MPPRLSPLASLITGLSAMALVGGAALLAAYLLGRFPAYRPYRRACLGFAGFCGFACLATVLNFIVPLFNQQPYVTLLNVAWLALSVALSAYLLWGARGRRESSGLLLLLVPTGLLLVMDAWPLLPPPPPLIEVAAAFVAIGTGYALPFWLLWRRYLSRYFLTRKASTFTLKVALLITVGDAACTAFLFATLFWQGRHPTALLSAFAWAGAYYLGITLLSCGGVIIRSLYRRGYFDRWLSKEQQQQQMG